MKINNINNTKFGAKFINNVKIQQFDSNTGDFRPKRASFVEFDPKNKKDLFAIRNATKDWDGDLFGRHIALQAEKIAKRYTSPYINHIYLLTSQLDNFEKLDKNGILGLAQMEINNNKNNLHFLQVKPSSTFLHTERNYKKVGASIIESLKKLYKRNISLISTTKAVNFYMNQGFELINEDMLKFGWEIGKKKI